VKKRQEWTRGERRERRKRKTHLLDLIAGEGRVGSREEVTPWRRNEARDHRNEVVVHVAGVAEGLSRGGHDGGDLRCQALVRLEAEGGGKKKREREGQREERTNKLIRLRHIRRPNLQPILAQILQRLIIQHNDTIRILSQALKRQHAVVRLNDDVGVCRIGEDGVGLDEFFGKDV
jgi:hypothetical protein